jgi:hypothetical protein
MVMVSKGKAPGPSRQMSAVKQTPRACVSKPHGVPMKGKTITSTFSKVKI